MILPDVNVLVYASRADTPQHDECAQWLRKLVDRGHGLALCDTVIFDFLRIVTNPRIMSPPTPIDHALEFARWLGESPGVQWLSSSPAVWRAFDDIAREDRGVRGNLIPDAYIAALCVAHGATVATNDRDFARFDGLRRLDPLAI